MVKKQRRFVFPIGSEPWPFLNHLRSCEKNGRVLWVQKNGCSTLALATLPTIIEVRERGLGRVPSSQEASCLPP